MTVIVLSFKDQRYENVNAVLTKFLTNINKEEIDKKLIIVYEDRYRIIQ